jgi:hypothetical protein
MTADTIGAPHKITIRVDKHFDGDTSHDPDETVEVAQWFEADGSEVTDPARVAQLEASSRKDEA